jgi:hypothetical protein
MRPDRLWRASIAAGGKPYQRGPAEGASGAAAATEPLKGQQPLAAVLSFLKAHAYTIGEQSGRDEAAFGRQRSELLDWLRARIRALLDTRGRRRRPYYSASARP